MKKILSYITLAICLVLPLSLFMMGCKEDKTNDAKICKVSTLAQLQEKLTTAEDDTEIVLQENITVTEVKEFKACFVVNKKVKLNLNGKTIQAKIGTGYDPSISLTENSMFDTTLISMFVVNAGGDLTITGNGTLDSAVGDLYTFNVNGGKLTIKNGTIKGSCSAIQVVCGTAIIEGGTYSVYPAGNTNDHRYLLNLIDDNGKSGSAKIVVVGGSFENFNPSVNLSENPAKDYVLEGYSVKTSNNTYTVAKD